MGAEESLRGGDPVAALAELQDLIRAEPDRAKHRIFLIQLLAVLGRWDRALNQLNLLGEMDPGCLVMVQVYREVLQCEVLRAHVFAGDRTPLLFGEPEKWSALLLESLRHAASGDHDRGEELRDQAFASAPATAGSVDGKPFGWIADGDSRLGPTLEAIVNGRYYWIPFHHIRSIDLEEPGDLRDLVWMPARFVWANGGEAVGMVPTRYPGSESHDDGLIMLGRKTEWSQPGEATYLGLGQRMLTTDAGDHPLMEIRAIRLDSPGKQEKGPDG